LKAGQSRLAERTEGGGQFAERLGGLFNPVGRADDADAGLALKEQFAELVASGLEVVFPVVLPTPGDRERCR